MDVKKVLDETEQSLRPLRPPVAPSEDLEKERRAITIDARQNMVLAQFSLFLVVLSLIAYITLSNGTWDYLFTSLCGDCDWILSEKMSNGNSI
jgi:hypothetical protein